MRKTVVSLVVLLLWLVSAGVATADPRMETNKDFCHFILDPLNTDNEYFVADCGAVIMTTEKTAEAGTAKIQCEESNRVATGYATAVKTLPQTASPLAVGATVMFTSDNSDTPCTMVESNGRAYTSNKWQSTIKAVRNSKKGFVTLQYEIFCEEGRE